MSRLKMKKIVLFSILVCFLVALIGFGIFQKYHAGINDLLSFEKFNRFSSGRECGA